MSAITTVTPASVKNRVMPAPMPEAAPVMIAVLPFMGDFFTGVKRTSLDKAAGEIVTEIVIPELKPGEGSAYFKHAVRKAMDLAIIGVAAWVKMDGKKVADCRIAMGTGDLVNALKQGEYAIYFRGYKANEGIIEADVRSVNAEQLNIVFRRIREVLGQEKNACGRCGRECA